MVPLLEISILNSSCTNMLSKAGFCRDECYSRENGNPENNINGTQDEHRKLEKPLKSPQETFQVFGFSRG